jgi:hypothetical protein
VATFGGISLKRQKDAVLDDQLDKYTIYNQRTELVQRLLANKCEWCETIGKMEIHHVRKLADLNKRGRKSKPHWMRVMSERRRKTIALCKKCHDDLHAGRLDESPKPKG